MSNLDDYQEKLALISALPEKDIRTPVMPVDVYLQEAENLYHWCQDDIAPLKGTGLDWAIATDLPVRAGALREAQSIWFKKRFTQEAAEREWQTASVEGYDLRNTLLHSFRYAFRHQENLLSRVSDIADGHGHADMIQDLNDLAVLGQEYKVLLAKINLDPAELLKAAATADILSDLLARATTDREDNSVTKVIRDQAFTYLKTAVDEVRAAGQYVFWRNEARLKGYRSSYFKKLRGSSKASTTVSTTEAVELVS